MGTRLSEHLVTPSVDALAFVLMRKPPLDPQHLGPVEPSAGPVEPPAGTPSNHASPLSYMAPVPERCMSPTWRDTWQSTWKSTGLEHGRLLSIVRGLILSVAHGGLRGRHYGVLIYLGILNLGG